METEIVICFTCQGSGIKAETKELTYTGRMMMCPHCFGSGRLIKEIVFKPYIPPFK